MIKKSTWGNHTVETKARPWGSKDTRKKTRAIANQRTSFWTVDRNCCRKWYLQVIRARNNVFTFFQVSLALFLERIRLDRKTSLWSDLAFRYILRSYSLFTFPRSQSLGSYPCICCTLQLCLHGNSILFFPPQISSFRMNQTNPTWRFVAVVILPRPPLAEMWAADG